MTKFFFDVEQRGQRLIDDQGTDCADVEAAAREAAVTLGQMAEDELREPRDMTLAIKVRDERGTPCLTASVTFILTME